jgi:1-deoxy-D-xylulose-5-phosphate reductoisomerase
MFIDHQVGYLDIVKLCDACCEAHMADIVATPNLEEIVHYDQWVSDDQKHAGLMLLCTSLVAKQ